ncbi:hypothetical protein BGZ52_005886 [Haplosporangium bisporale]|nr:hypothetical protein BGZ52_005886 [Haplosporangium bisporale]
MDTKKQPTLGKAFSRPFKGKPAGSHAASVSTDLPGHPSNPVDTSLTPFETSNTNESSNGLNNVNGTKPGNIGLHNGNNVSNTFDASTHQHYGNGQGPRQTHAFTTMHPISPPSSPDIHFATNTNTKTTKKDSSSHFLPPLPFEAHARDATAMTNASTVSRISAGLSSFSSSGDDLFSGDGYGHNPTDILQARLHGYRSIVKNLQQFFAEVAALETTTSRAWSKAASVLVVPFKDGHQFLGKGGMQDVCAGLRDAAKGRGEQHAGVARFVEETVVKHLRRLKQDLKGKIRALKGDTNLYNNRVFRERELTQERIGGLARAIALYERAGGYKAEENMRSDPYLVNLALKKQLAKQVHEENLFARSLRQVQEEVATFESRIVKEVKQILNSYANYNRNNVSPAFNQSWAAAEAALTALQDNTEWNEFMDRNGYRLFPSELADTDLEEINYPGKQNPYVAPIKTAHLSRKSSVLKNWKDGFFVLTMAGWLHVFTTAPDATGTEAAPDRSIYVPTAVLGNHSGPSQKQHVFSLDGKGQGGLLHRDNQTFTIGRLALANALSFDSIRAHSRDEMLEWWTAVSKRARSDTATKMTENALSRSTTDVRSSPVKRTLSTKVAAPLPGDKASVHERSPSVGAAAATTAPAPAPVSAAVATAVPTTLTSAPTRPHLLERTNTGSTVSLNTEDLVAPSFLEK